VGGGRLAGATQASAYFPLPPFIQPGAAPPVVAIYAAFAARAKIFTDLDGHHLPEMYQYIKIRPDGTGFLEHLLPISTPKI